MLLPMRARPGALRPIGPKRTAGLARPAKGRPPSVAIRDISLRPEGVFPTRGAGAKRLRGCTKERSPGRFALPFVHLFSPMDCFFIENSFVRWFECVFRLCRWLHPSFRRSPHRKSRTSGQKIVEKDDFSIDKAHFGSVQL